ncbi:MAG: hypothetical protein AAF627_01155 [Myxococcota bacterium]
MAEFSQEELPAALWAGLGAPAPRALVMTGHAVTLAAECAGLRFARGPAALRFPMDEWSTVAFSSPWGPVRVACRVARRLVSDEDVFLSVEFERTPRSVADLEEMVRSLREGARAPEWRAEASPIEVGVETADLCDWAEALRCGRRRALMKIRRSSSTSQRITATREGLEADLEIDRALAGCREQSR